MDPLSITASIIAIIQLAGKVISICYEYRKGILQTPRNATNIIDQVESLKHVLDQLVKVAEAGITNGSSRLSTLEQLNRPGGPLAKCHAEMAALIAELEPASGWRTVGQALIWPLKRADVRKALDTISNAKATLHLALSADQTAVLLGMQEDIAALNRSFKTLQLCMDAAPSTRYRAQRQADMRVLDDHRQMIHRWLSAPDPSIIHNTACKAKQATTGAWLIGCSQFSTWKSTPNSFLWLHGIRMFTT